MRATFGHQDLPAADAHRSARLGPVMRRWRPATITAETPAGAGASGTASEQLVPLPADRSQLLWELRRLIAWSGGTIADVARALEARGAELDPTARRLLQDELEAVEVDLATAGLYLADPIDWDSEFESLLDGEVAPLDDLPDAEDDENTG